MKNRSHVALATLLSCSGAAVVAVGRHLTSNEEAFGKNAALSAESGLAFGGNTSPGSKATTNKVDATKAHASASDGNTPAKKAKQPSAPAAGVMASMTTRGGPVGRKHFK